MNYKFIPSRLEQLKLEILMKCKYFRQFVGKLIPKEIQSWQKFQFLHFYILEGFQQIRAQSLIQIVKNLEIVTDFGLRAQFLKVCIPFLDTQYIITKVLTIAIHEFENLCQK